MSARQSTLFEHETETEAIQNYERDHDRKIEDRDLLSSLDEQIANIQQEAREAIEGGSE